MMKSMIHALGRSYLTRLNKSEHEAQCFVRQPIEYRFLFDCLSSLLPRTVLDVGAGRTALPRIIASCGCVVTAIDNITDYWPHGMVNRHWHIIDDDIRKPRIKQRFDMLTCVSVIEHIDDPMTAFRSMIALLEPGGHLVLTMPYNERRFVPNVYDLPETAYGKDAPYICSSTSRAELDEWVRTTGVEIVSQEYWRFWTGEVWAQGEQAVVPHQVGPTEPHNLTCILARKAPAGV